VSIGSPPRTSRESESSSLFLVRAGSRSGRWWGSGDLEPSANLLRFSSARPLAIPAPQINPESFFVCGAEAKVHTAHAHVDTPCRCMHRQRIKVTQATVSPCDSREDLIPRYARKRRNWVVTIGPWQPRSRKPPRPPRSTVSPSPKHEHQSRDVSVTCRQRRQIVGRFRHRAGVAHWGLSGLSLFCHFALAVAWNLYNPVAVKTWKAAERSSRSWSGWPVCLIPVIAACAQCRSKQRVGGSGPIGRPCSFRHRLQGPLRAPCTHSHLPLVQKFEVPGSGEVWHCGVGYESMGCLPPLTLCLRFP
jgi:hypothetical protein